MNSCPLVLVALEGRCDPEGRSGLEAPAVLRQLALVSLARHARRRHTTTEAEHREGPMVVSLPSRLRHPVCTLNHLRRPMCHRSAGAGFDFGTVLRSCSIVAFHGENLARRKKYIDLTRLNS